MSTVPQLSGYRIVALVYESPQTLVYRGIREGARHQPVVIKVPRNPFPSFDKLVQFRNQYTIARNLNHPNILKSLALEPYQNGYALVMEDFQGISLKEYLKQTGPWGNTLQRLTAFLQVALQVVDALSELHRQRVIHKDLKPSNILINPDTWQVKLADFGIASLLPRETQEIQTAHALEGTLAYLAPEQTGRMNRAIDYRSDFYALGITFYQLLTGQLPFVSDDPMELIHCHLAKQPLPPHEVQASGSIIPPILSDIVLKLMAKNAEDRYQTALGIRHDLEQCLVQWQKHHRIAPFQLGRRDVSDRFLIPEKLYGRDQEVQTLLDAFTRIASSPADNAPDQPPSQTPNPPSPIPHPKSELVLVTGFSGIGKTAVVNEVHKPITRQHGYFIKGKFDQFNRNIPFSGVVQALRDLMRQVLSESDAQLQSWKSQMLAALGESGQVMIDVIPELERVIGPQPAAVELSGMAAQNRFNLLFQKFIQVFATPAHPLVLFLDDLQWADSASLNLMHQVMTDLSTGYLLLIGAYRDNEVSPAHPLMLAIAAIARAGATVNTITLQPLTPADLNHLVADTLHCSEAVAQPLTDLVVQKTRGNPFFATQFLRALHQEGLITFDWQAGHWQCDLVRVRDAALTDDVVEFMALQLQKLPASTQEVLKLAACIGNQFDLATLAIVSQQSEIETGTRLWTALQQGFILPQSQIYKFFQEDSATRSPATTRQTSGVGGDHASQFWMPESGSCCYRFLHDRVQQAAYSLIPDDQKQATHYHIGQLLLQQISPAEQEERIFELVNQLNWGTALIADQGDRDDLAHLNLIAGRRAKAATAYQAGRDYAAVGLSLLGAAAWQRQYSLTLALHELAAESASLCGDFAQMEQWIDAVIAQAHTLLETIPVYRTRILAHVYQNKLTEAIAIGQQTLQRLGVQFPEAPTAADMQQQIQTIATLIGDRPIEDLVHIPVMSDPTSLAITQIASSLLGTAYLSGSPLYPLLVLLGVRLSIQSGNTLASPVSYAFYGAILCNLLQDVETGVQFGQLALNIVATLEAKAAKPEVIGAVVAFILHRKRHFRDLLPIAKEGYITGLEVGSLEYAGYNAILFCVKAFNCGQPLATLEPEVRAYSNGMVQLHQLTAANYCWIIWQSILNLLGRSEHPTRLTGEALQEAEFLPSLLAANDPGKLFQFYLFKAMLCFLFGEIAPAMTQITEARKYLRGAVGLVGEATLYFYDSLIAIAHWEQSADNLAAVLQRVADNQTQLQQFWAQYAPMNYQHKVDLVTAEHYRLLGKHYEAADWYDRAIAAARDNGYIQEAALANELAARFYLHWGKEKVAAGYLQEAYYDYARWGAKAKTDDLENRYPQLLASVFQVQHHHFAFSQTNPQTVRTASSINQTIFNQTMQTSHASSHWSAATLDFASILKASQALSSEIHLDQLVAKLLQVVMENSGAKKAALLIAQDDSLSIEAVATLTDAGVTGFSVPLCDGEGISLSLVNYVKHSLKTVVLDDATAQTDFAADPYLFRHQPRSVLCTPILNQGKFIGLLYLENPLTVAAFTCDRLEVVHLLCTQAAISLENARLYRNLQASEARYQRLAENVPGMIYQFRLSPEGHRQLSYISPRCVEIFEVEPEAVLADAQVILDMVHPDDVAEFEQSILASAQTLQPWRWVGRVLLPAGRVKWIQGISRPECQADGAIVWDGILMDVSDRKQAELEILQLNQALEQQNQNLETLVEQRTAELGRRTVQLEASNQELESFSYSVSHDLRAPLRHINGFVNALRQQLQNHNALADPKVAHYVQVIQSSSQKMAELIDGLLDLSRIGRKPMECKPVSLRQLVDEAIASLQPNPDLGTVAEFVIGELPTVQGDARLLQQVFSNLISNAVKFSRHHPTPRIEIGSLPTGVIFVRDNGAGFDMKYANKLFGPFQRLHTPAEFEGSGIGLAIVQRIIHRHGGAIWAESQPDQGATFYFTLGSAA